MSPLGIMATALGGVVALAIGLIQGERWLANRYKAQGRTEVWDNLNNTFVADIATNHLPHIQNALELIAKKVGVDLPDPPPIRYMPDPKEKK